MTLEPETNIVDTVVNTPVFLGSLAGLALGALGGLLERKYDIDNGNSSKVHLGATVSATSALPFFASAENMLSGVCDSSSVAASAFIAYQAGYRLARGTTQD